MTARTTNAGSGIMPNLAVADDGQKLRETVVEKERQFAGICAIVTAANLIPMSHLNGVRQICDSCLAARMRRFNDCRRNEKTKIVTLIIGGMLFRQWSWAADTKSSARQ